MTQMTVHKLNTQGEVTVTYDAELAERLVDGVRLEARWTREPLSLGYTTFETGDRFIEWYYRDRWYNIFEIHGADDTLKGWYCNVAAPATITADTIACRDLLLDLWVAPDGTSLVLDADEFAADTTLDAMTRAQAEHALALLREMVSSRQLPFTALPPA